MKIPLAIALTIGFHIPAFVAQAEGVAWDDEGKEHLEKIATDADNLKKERETVPPEQQKAYDDKIKQNLKEMDSIADKHAGNPKAQTDIAQTFLGIDEPGRALNRADRAVTLAPDDPAARIVHGQANFKLKRYEEAAEDARRALKLAPGDPAATTLLRLSQGRAASAPRKDSTPPSNQPGAPASQASAGSAPSARAYAGQAQAQATAVSIKAAALAEESLRKGKLGDADEALKLAEKAVSLDPRSARALTARSEAKRAIKDNQGALDDAEAAVRLDERYPEAYLARAQAKRSLGRAPSEVLADFEEAGRLESGFANFYQEALAAYQKSGALASEAFAAGGGPGSGTGPGASGSSGAAASRGTGSFVPSPLVLSVLALIVIGAVALWLTVRSR